MQGCHIPLIVHSGHDGSCDAGDEGLVSEIFTGVDVGKVNFYGFQSRGDHGVSQGNARVSKTAGVEY